MHFVLRAKCQSVEETVHVVHANVDLSLSVSVG